MRGFLSGHRQPRTVSSEAKAVAPSGEAKAVAPSGEEKTVAASGEEKAAVEPPVSAGEASAPRERKQRQRGLVSSHRLSLGPRSISLASDSLLQTAGATRSRAVTTTTSTDGLRRRSTAIFGSDAVLVLIGPPGSCKLNVLQLLAARYAPGLSAQIADFGRIVVNKDLPPAGSAAPDYLQDRDWFSFDVCDDGGEFWQWAEASGERTAELLPSLTRLAASDGFVFVYAHDAPQQLDRCRQLQQLIATELKTADRPSHQCFVVLALCATADDAAAAAAANADVCAVHCPAQVDAAATDQPSSLEFAVARTLDEQLERCAVELLRARHESRTAVSQAAARSQAAASPVSSRHSNEYVDSADFIWSKKFTRDSVPSPRAASFDKLVAHLMSPQATSQTLHTFLVSFPAFATRYDVFAVLESYWNCNSPAPGSSLSLSSSSPPSLSPLSSSPSSSPLALSLSSSSPPVVRSPLGRSSTLAVAAAQTPPLLSASPTSVSTTSSTASLTSLRLSDGGASSEAKAVRSRVLNALRHWISYFDYFCDPTLVYLLDRFLSVNQAKQESRQLLQNMTVQFLQQQAEHGRPQRQPSHLCSKSILPKKLRPGKPLRFVDIPELEAARQLTLLDFDAFSSIGVLEWCKSFLAGSGREKLGATPDCIRTLIRQFNERVAWFSYLVLEPTEPQARAQVIKHLIKVANHLLELKSFSALLAISATLESVPIHRLTRTWEQVGKQTVGDYNTFIKPVCAPAGNYQALRDHIDSLSPPVVPYIGMYLSDLTFIQEGNPSKLGELINFEKCIMFARVVSILQTYQRAPYFLEQVPAIRSYFLSFSSSSLRQADTELYNLSLQREPRQSSSSSATSVAAAPLSPSSSASALAASASSSSLLLSSSPLQSSAVAAPPPPPPLPQAPSLSSFEVLSNFSDADGLFTWLTSGSPHDTFTLLVFLNHCLSRSTILPLLSQTFRQAFLGFGAALLRPLFKRVVALVVDSGRSEENVRYEVLVFFRFCLTEPASSHTALFDALCACPRELLTNADTFDRIVDAVLLLLPPSPFVDLPAVLAGALRVAELSKLLARPASRTTLPWTQLDSVAAVHQAIDEHLSLVRVSAARLSLVVWLITAVPSIQDELRAYLETTPPLASAGDLSGDQAELPPDVAFFNRLTHVVHVAQIKARSSFISAYSTLNTVFTINPPTVILAEHTRLTLDFCRELRTLVDAQPPPPSAAIDEVRLRGRAAYTFSGVVFAEVEHFEPCAAVVSTFCTSFPDRSAVLKNIADMRSMLSTFYDAHPLFAHLQLLPFDKSIAASIWNKAPLDLLAGCKAPALHADDAPSTRSGTDAFSLRHTCYEWSTSRVASWLLSAGLPPQYAAVFEQRSINGLDLLYLSRMAVVIDLGISDEQLWTTIDTMQSGFRESMGHGELLLLALGRLELLAKTTERPAERKSERRIQPFQSLPNLLSSSSYQDRQRSRPSASADRPSSSSSSPSSSSSSSSSSSPSSSPPPSREAGATEKLQARSRIAQILSEAATPDLQTIFAYPEVFSAFKAFLGAKGESAAFLLDYNQLCTVNELPRAIELGRKLYNDFMAPNAAKARVYVESEEDSIFMELFGNFLTSPSDVTSLFEFSTDAVRASIEPAVASFWKSVLD